VDINIIPDNADGRLMVYIDYLVAESNTRDNLVFPFYLDTVEEQRENDK